MVSQWLSGVESACVLIILAGIAVWVQARESYPCRAWRPRLPSRMRWASDPTAAAAATGQARLPTNLWLRLVQADSGRRHRAYGTALMALLRSFHSNLHPCVQAIPRSLRGRFSAGGSREEATDAGKPPRPWTKNLRRHNVVPFCSPLTALACNPAHRCGEHGIWGAGAGGGA